MREYLLVLRRRRWWVAAFVVLGVVLSGAYIMQATPVYTSTADVLVNAQQFGNKAGPLATQVSMPTEVDQVTSQTIGEVAAKQLPWWHGTTPELLQHVTVTNPSNTLVLAIAFTSLDPQHAKAGADAFANAYVEQRTIAVKPAAAEAAVGLRTQITNARNQIPALIAALKSDKVGSTEYVNDQKALGALNLLIAQSKTGLKNLEEPVGSVTSQGTVPDAPSSPRKVKTLVEGLMLGLLLGVIAAFVRDRMSDLPRDRDEIELIIGAPVLATEQPESPMQRRLRTWRGERVGSSWTSHRLLGLVLERWMGRDQPGTPAIMLASPVAGPDTALVAAEASRSLAWAGRRVTCISSAIGDDSLSSEFELRNDVGFSSIVAGDVSVAESARRIGMTDLRVVPSGPPTARSAEVLTTRGLPVLGSVVEELKAGSDVVVVAGPPLLGPNGGVAIATVVDFVIVVVSAKTTREELHETKWRLGEMGVGVLGAVVAQQMSRHRIRHLRRTSREDADAAANTTLVDAGVGQNGRIRSDRPLPDEPLELRRPAGGTGTRTPRRSSRAGRTSGFSGPSNPGGRPSEVAGSSKPGKPTQR